MQKCTRTIRLIFAALMLVSGGSGFAQRRRPRNLRRMWPATGPSTPKETMGRRARTISRIIQNGENLTGHFKGPNQSGGIQGTINSATYRDQD